MKVVAGKGKKIKWKRKRRRDNGKEMVGWEGKKRWFREVIGKSMENGW